LKKIIQTKNLSVNKRWTKKEPYLGILTHIRTKKVQQRNRLNQNNFDNICTAFAPKCDVNFIAKDSNTQGMSNGRINCAGKGYRMKKIVISILVPVAIATFSQITVRVVDVVFDSMDSEAE
jgi:hypothetical protein